MHSFVLIVRSVTRSYYRGAAGALLVYDIARLVKTSVCYAWFYELGLTRDSRVIPGLTVVSVLSTSNLGLNWD